MFRLSSLVFCSLLLSLVAPVYGQENKATEKAVDKQELYRKLEETLTNTKFIGQFTVIGREQEKPAAEEYTILSAKKSGQGEMWLLTARIKYGEHDLTLPMPLVIEWAGTTPVITLDKVTLPGLGTFSSRVVIHDGKYAGTWQHDQTGGHLFGRIEKLQP